MPESEATTGPVEAGPVDAGPDTDPGTQAVEVTWDSLATMRPMGTQAVFRPQFDDSTSIPVPVPPETTMLTLASTQLFRKLANANEIVLFAIKS